MMDAILGQQGCIILDGGLATELERKGHDLNHRLWSARLLIDNPRAIRQVHEAYLHAGADCIVTATYQAGMAGMLECGLSRAQARDAIALAVQLACDARDEYVAQLPGNRCAPLVAAGIGPYGAYLADGSEYTGRYNVSADALRGFHEPRWEILLDSGADLLALETIPSQVETEVLLELLSRGNTPAWLSFSCRDDAHICDGTPIAACAALARDCRQIVAIGVNCTPPRHIGPLIDRIKAAAPEKHVVVYPNSGEAYDIASRSWTGSAEPGDFGELARRWLGRGARLIGGCCRTTPDHVRAIRIALLGASDTRDL